MSEQMYRYPTKADIGITTCEFSDNRTDWRVGKLAKIEDNASDELQYRWVCETDEEWMRYCRIPIDRQAVQESIPCESSPAYPPLRERLIQEAMGKLITSNQTHTLDHIATWSLKIADDIIARMNEEGGQQ